MSHKGIIGIIIVGTIVVIGVYSSMAFIEQPLQGSWINQIVTERTIVNDEPIIQKQVDVHNEKWGRTNTNNGTNHHVIINDGVFGTVTQE